MTATKIHSALRAVARKEKAAFFPAFFQAMPGGYGEGDRFLGCVVPDQRRIATQFQDLARSELIKLFASPWHECRLTGMMILVSQYERAAKPKNARRQAECREIVEFYLANRAALNNWDLVDATAPKLLGPWLVENPQERHILDRLAASDVLWEQRLAVLATWALIRNHEFREIIRLAEALIHSTHDLMHKAIGWMLREMGKRDLAQLEKFLTKHARIMPRTMLRYSIEKLSRDERTKWMHL